MTRAFAWSARRVTADSPGFKVLVVGGTIAGPVLEVVRELTNVTGFAVLVWCPALEARELRGASRLPVQVLTDRSALFVDRIYLLPADRRVSIDGDQLVTGSLERGPFDHVLRSIADSFGSDSIGVVLAGRGADGSLGIKRIKEAGGLTIAQQPEAGDLTTAQQPEGEDSSLPSSAIETGFIDLVLPLDQIAQHVAQLGQPSPSQVEDPDAIDGAMSNILTLLRVRSGHDFASYKRATLVRRIARRMQVCECATLEGYLRHLRDHAAEMPNLLRDFLISVTNFFRDPTAFEAIESNVVPKLFDKKTTSDQLRVWTVGCATGEEAYSLGILLLEHAQTLQSPPKIQIFATDIDEAALVEARAGVYSAAIAADVSQARLARFFTRENDRYRVSKDLRDIVLFSPHNLLRDPPFSRLDLISCRNLLIYFDRDAQNRALTTFHFGLRLRGLLFLGSSESAETSTLFAITDGKARLFERQGVAPVLRAQVGPLPTWHAPLLAPIARPRERSPSPGELHYQMVERFAPPSVLVDSELEVLHLSEHANRYLTLVGGEPTRHILQLVHPALRLELRTAIFSARQTGNERRIVRFEDRQVELRVHAVDVPELGRGSFLIMFDDLPIAESPIPIGSGEALIEPVVRELENELKHTRIQLRTTVEQYESSVEELKASNEELQAINEELRSATEELEASKEELQSVNEELTTLNHELKLKVDELGRANSDLQNLMMSTEIGVIFLDRSLHIKRFTPRVQDVFNIIATDVGRALSDLTHRLRYDDLAETAQSVLKTLQMVEKEVTTRGGKSYLVRWLPYRSIDNRIDGVVITLIDVSDLREAVTARRRSETALLAVEERLRLAVRIAPIAVLSFSSELELTWAYVMGRELGGEQLDLLGIFTETGRASLKRALGEVAELRRGQRIELEMRNDDRVFDFRIEPSPTGITAVGFDITSSKLAETSLREADRRKDEFLATLSHELRNPLAPLRVAIDLAKLVGDDPAKRKHSLEVMERQVAMLTHLVDELLDLSRITQGKVRLDVTSIPLDELVESAVEAASALIDANKHELKIQLPPERIEVRGDLRRLTQVLGNLLMNAAKYTPSPGTIAVAAKHDGTSVAIEIADNGIGIAPENLGSIFDIFVQSRDEEGRSKGGLGIGLNVVRQLVELHGGTAIATSKGLGHGSAFTIQLPVVKA